MSELAQLNQELTWRGEIDKPNCRFFTIPCFDAVLKHLRGGGLKGLKFSMDPLMLTHSAGFWI
jgi:hypothetical protein